MVHAVVFGLAAALCVASLAYARRHSRYGDHLEDYDRDRNRSRPQEYMDRNGDSTFPEDSEYQSDESKPGDYERHRNRSRPHQYMDSHRKRTNQSDENEPGDYERDRNRSRPQQYMDSHRKRTYSNDSQHYSGEDRVDGSERRQGTTPSYKQRIRRETPEETDLGSKQRTKEGFEQESPDLMRGRRYKRAARRLESGQAGQRYNGKGVQPEDDYDDNTGIYEGGHDMNRGGPRLRGQSGRFGQRYNGTDARRPVYYNEENGGYEGGHDRLRDSSDMGGRWGTRTGRRGGQRMRGQDGPSMGGQGVSDMDGRDVSDMDRSGPGMDGRGGPGLNGRGGPGMNGRGGPGMNGRGGPVMDGRGGTGMHGRSGPGMNGRGGPGMDGQGDASMAGQGGQYFDRRDGLDTDGRGGQRFNRRGGQNRRRNFMNHKDETHYEDDEESLGNVSGQDERLFNDRDKGVNIDSLGGMTQREPSRQDRRYKRELRNVETGVGEIYEGPRQSRDRQRTSFVQTRGNQKGEERMYGRARENLGGERGGRYQGTRGSQRGIQGGHAEAASQGSEKVYEGDIQSPNDDDFLKKSEAALKKAYNSASRNKMLRK